MNFGDPGIDVGFGVEPDKLSVSECLKFSETAIDFGVREVGEYSEPVRISVVDQCGLWEMLERELDDPDAAFDAQSVGDLSTELSFTTDEVGRYEAQWILRPSDDIGEEFSGMASVQLFGEVVAASEE